MGSAFALYSAPLVACYITNRGPASLFVEEMRGLVLEYI